MAPALRRQFRNILLASAMAGAVLSLTSCSGASSGDAPWSVRGGHIADNFAELVDQALTSPRLEEFEREVLERAKKAGRIEQADYDEAYARFATCMEVGGEPVKLKKFGNGLYKVDTTPLSEGETLESAIAVLDACSAGTVNHLAALYGTQQGNPRLLANPYEVAYECLEAKGIVASDFPFEEFAEVLRTPGSEGGSLDDRMPFDIYADEADACFVGASIFNTKATS
jgi:hypothetical protein